MADQISVNFASLQAGSQALSAKATALTTCLQDLQSNLAPLKENWYASGSSAGDAAQQCETRLRSATADIVNIIAQFSQKVSEAHDQQYSLEQRNTSYFA
ncbi:MAG TPA: WXG100 family type VII secretion target [Pseudonocardiaceae bacterium]|nr:WXG100 family type VII secretion target [Pseudonocardiaceae bacterium]